MQPIFSISFLRHGVMIAVMSKTLLKLCKNGFSSVAHVTIVSRHHFTRSRIVCGNGKSRYNAAGLSLLCYKLNHCTHFLEKKDMMFPCPFGAAFLVFAVVGATDTFAFLGAGSSSEKDSQAASSRVTTVLVSTRSCWVRALIHTKITLFVLDRLLFHHPSPAPPAAIRYCHSFFRFCLRLCFRLGIRFVLCTF